MNQEKIGEFIAKKRKEKNLTQENLSENLGISINAVSKWERGICLMDMSLLKPLSKILGVTINEILSGEEISEKDLRNKTDENIINITELYDLKAIQKGTVVFTIVLLLFLICFARKNRDTLPIIIIWLCYSLTYSFNKYKFMKSRKEFITTLVYGIGLLIAVILFLIETF